MKEVLYVGSDCCEDFLKLSKENDDLAVLIAETGKKGISHLQRKFDLVVISVNIPDISSWELLHKIKGKNPSKVALFGTIPLSSERLKSLKRDGFSDYLHGLRGNSLLKRVKKLL